MAHYPVRITVNGMPIDSHKACPFCDSIELDWPAFVNRNQPTRLSQPLGPVGDDFVIHPNGIVSPTDGRAATSGETDYYKYPWANDGYHGKDSVTYYGEMNHYQQYWYCLTCSGFFTSPVPQNSSLPGGVVNGSVDYPFNTTPESEIE
jgi:hypothetical protein